MILYLCKYFVSRIIYVLHNNACTYVYDQKVVCRRLENDCRFRTAGRGLHYPRPLRITIASVYLRWWASRTMTTRWRHLDRSQVRPSNLYMDLVIKFWSPNRSHRRVITECGVIYMCHRWYRYSAGHTRVPICLHDETDILHLYVV